MENFESFIELVIAFDHGTLCAPVHGTENEFAKRKGWCPPQEQRDDIGVGKRASYTPKNYHLFKVVENRMQQCCAAHIVHSCLSTILFSIVEPESARNQVEQC